MVSFVFLIIVLVILTKEISILFIPKEGLLNISTSNIAVIMGVGQISTNFGTRCRSLNMICIYSYFQVLTSYLLAYFLRSDFPLVLKSHCYHDCAYQLSLTQ